MEVWSDILRLVVVSLISVILSILAMLTIRGLGIDLKDFKQRTNPKVLAVAAVFNLLFIGAVALILGIWDHKSLRILGFSLDSTGIVFSIAALVITLSTALIYVWALHTRKVLKIKWTGELFNNSTPLENTLLAFVVLFIAALQEEILFRGYFAFRLLPYGFWYALIISTIVFTFWHFLTNRASLFQVIDWLAGGIMLFYIYWLSGSIWIAALIHFSRNFTNVLVFNIAGSNAIVSYEKPIASSYKTIYTILNSILIILFGFLFYG